MIAVGYPSDLNPNIDVPNCARCIIPYANGSKLSWSLISFDTDLRHFIDSSAFQLFGLLRNFLGLLIVCLTLLNVGPNSARRQSCSADRKYRRGICGHLRGIAEYAACPKQERDDQSREATAKSEPHGPR